MSTLNLYLFSALFHLDDDTFGKGEKSQRGTKKAYFFKDTPQKLTVAIGQTAVLLCRVKNLGNRTVSLTERSQVLLDFIVYLKVARVLAIT